MTCICKTIFPIIFLIAGLKTQAQVYPVNGNAALIPPYSVYLADYTSRATERLMVNVVLNDVTRPELRVRLRVRIESQNIRIETKPEYIGSEIILQGGVPLRLNGTDLIEYFSPNNLNFSGLTRREFEKTGALPQGFYQFSFEVLEYNRGVKISNTISAPAWLILNDPPIVNLPRNNEKLKPTQPQNLIFQWTPRHTGSPNSAFSTEYTIEMVEVWPANRNPNDAILTSPRILETTTRSTTFIYGPAETPLELGRQYALRIQAKSIVGVEEFDLFKNHGYSEVVTFVYGDACDMPGNIRIDAAATKFNVMWDGQFNHSAYTFRYRQTGTANWYESNTAINEVNIYSLTPNTTYEYQVAGTCGVFGGEYSPIASLKTSDLGEASYSCGLPLETFNLDPAELTGSLNVGDIIQAGDFQVKLAKVSGSNGTFSGEGVIEVPFFNKAKVKAEFTDIAVNKELRMVTGFMNVTGAGLEVIPSGVMDLMDDLSEALNQIDSTLNNIQANLPQPFDPNSFVADTLISIPGEISNVYKDLDGTIVVVDQQGNETRLPPGEDYAIKDDKGNGYLVDSTGGIHKTTAENAAKAGNREFNLKLKFTEAPLTRFGFDEKKHDALSGYEQLEGNYNVHWKSVATGATDPVIARLEDTSIDKSKVRFELFSIPAQAPPFSSDQTTTLTVTGKSDGMVEDLIALYTPADTSDNEQVLGKLKVITYDKITRNLVIVPVNNNTYPGSTAQLTQDLNTIFGQVAVEWSVTLAQGINVSLDETFDDGESGLLTNYTDDMKKVINAYKDNLQDGTYYLFLVSKPKSGNTLGYMPRSKQAGFIFVDVHEGDQNKLTHTIAHELGHGAFNLKHTFSEFPSITKNSTDNLMDYNNGTHLFKYQWDNVHHPQIVIGFFESDEEGAYYDKSRMIKFLSTLKSNNEKFTNISDPQAQAYLTSNIVTEQDLRDQKIIDYFSNLSIYKFSPQYSAVDPIVQSWLTIFNENKDDVWTKLITEKPNPIPYDQNPILLAREMDVETETKEKFTLSMNGYSLSDKSITLYAHETKVGNDTKLTFFNGLIAPSGQTNNADDKNKINIRKAFDIVIHSENAQAFKDYIKLRGTISIADEDPESEKIIIDIVRKRSNNYITISELSIRSTNIKGAALELGKGTEAEQRSSCNNYKATCFECKRVPTGTFDFIINDLTSEQGQHKFKTLRLLNTKTNNSERDGILIHMGDALSWTQGCLLALYDNEIEEITQDDSNIDSRVMGYLDQIDEKNASRTFILSVIEFIEEKEKRLGKTVAKQVVIKDDINEKTLNVSTNHFDLLQKANRYYYSNNLYDKAVEQFILFATNLQEKYIQDKIQSKLTEYTEKLAETLTPETYKESEVSMLYETKWNELYDENTTSITVTTLQNEVLQKVEDFRLALKDNFKTFITTNDIVNTLFNENAKTLLRDNVFNSFSTKGSKVGFTQKIYTQSLFDKISTDTRSKMITSELNNLSNIINK